MLVIFENSRYERKVIGTLYSEDPFTDAMRMIEAFIFEKNPSYKIRYVRNWFSPDGQELVYDVGSHSEFFYLRAENDEEKEKIGSVLYV